MRCVCCDKNLNDFESTRKHAETGSYLDMCNACLRAVDADIPVVVRQDLEPMEFIDHEDDFYPDEDTFTLEEGYDN